MNDIEYLGSEKHMVITDLALASAMQSLGFTIVALERDPKDYPKVGFVFKRCKKFNDAVNLFWSGSLLVDPKGFWDISRGLKSRIYSVR